MGTPLTRIPRALRHDVVVAFAALYENCKACGNREGIARAVETVQRLGLEGEKWWVNFLNRKGHIQ